MRAVFGKNSRHFTRERPSRFLSYLGALVFALMLPVFSTPVRAQTDREAADSIGNFFGNLTRKAFDDAVWKSWLKVPPDLQLCMFISYKMTPPQLAQRGVSANSRDMKYLLKDCAERMQGPLADSPEERALLDRAVARWRAEILAHVRETGERLGQDAEVAIGATAGVLVNDGIQAVRESRARKAERKAAEERAQAEQAERARRIADLQLRAQSQAATATPRDSFSERLRANIAANREALDRLRSGNVGAAPAAQPATPSPAPVPETPPTATISPTPSPGGRQFVQAGEPFTFVENYSGGALGTVSVYQHGDLIALNQPPKQVALAYGYQPEVRGPYSANGATGTNLITTEQSRSSISTMPTTTAGLASIVVSSPYVSPPPPDTIDPQYGTGGRLPSVPSAPVPTQITSTNNGYTFVPTVNNTVEVFKNGELIVAGMPAYVAAQRYGYVPPDGVSYLSVGNTNPPPPPSPVYTFQETQWGTVEIYEDGRRVATGTPSAAAVYGYVPSAKLTPTPSPTTPSYGANTPPATVSSPVSIGSGSGASAKPVGPPAAASNQIPNPPAQPTLPPNLTLKTPPQLLFTPSEMKLINAQPAWLRSEILSLSPAQVSALRQSGRWGDYQRQMVELVGIEQSAVNAQIYETRIKALHEKLLAAGAVSSFVPGVGWAVSAGIAGPEIVDSTRRGDAPGVVFGVLSALPDGGGASKAFNNVARWGDFSTLASHFSKHGAEFGAKSAEEYAKIASEFFRKSQVEKYPTKISSDGTIRIWNPKEGIFGI